MSWDRRKTRFLTWFFPGRKLGNRCGGAVEIPAFSQPYPRDYPWDKPGFRWKFWDFPGFSLVEYQGFPSFFPGFSLVVRLVTKNLVSTREKPGIPARATKPWYLPGKNLGIYRFPRETDKYQGKIGFPGFSLVKS